jgi:hypothetical protein
MGAEGRKRETVKRQLSQQEQIAKRQEEQQNLRNIEAFERERRSLRNIGREAKGQYTGAMSDFGRETSGTPTQISRLQELIRQQALPEQRRAMSQGRLALQQQGVRGPESALMQQMQANTMQEALANRAEQVAMQQALSDREKRQSLASQRALISLEPSFKAGLKGGIR